jgi:hypothetical protein
MPAASNVDRKDDDFYCTTLARVVFLKNLFLPENM